MKQTGTLKKLALILVLVVLLPALFYSVYEVNSISNTEKLIATVYLQQLDVILFSLNQYALDVANNWASTVNILLNENRESKPDSLRVVFDRFLRKNSSISGVFISDTSLTNHTFYTSTRKTDTTRINDSSILQSLTINKGKIARLLAYQRIEYRKIEPIQLGAGGEDQTLALVFVVSNSRGISSIVTIVLNEQVFIREILSSKLREAAGDEMVLAILQGGVEQTVYATSSIQANEIKQNKPLWLFPNYYLGISLKGVATIEELTLTRFYRNLVLIILLDVVLIAGVWIVYKNIRRQIELVRLKSDFVSNVSHELRTPLALIRMYAETLEMDRIRSEEKKREYYSTILQETERLTRLINKILDFSRMEAGKKQYQFGDVDLNTVISELLDTYTSHLRSEGFEPVVQLDDAIPIISGDKEALTEAVINILDNAVKYSGAEKYIRIATRKGERTVSLEIEDRGMGIAPEHHKKIFENFYRVSGALVHNIKGSGLGLALVKHIVEAHDGTIHLTSAPGNGSTFRLEFPFKKEMTKT